MLGLMIAVLPVRNLTQDAADDPVAGGITEELISQLGEIQPARLGVIGRSSVDRYRNAAPGLDQVGRDLGVAYVVEGALRDSGGREIWSAGADAKMLPLNSYK